MKKLILILSIIWIFISTNSYSQNGWFVQSTNQPGGTLRDLFFINSQTGWITQDSGKLIKTTDGGVTWIQYNSGGVYHLYSIKFVNDMTGWAAGGWLYNNPLYVECEVMVKTTNGGINWVTQITTTNGIHFNTVAAANDNYVFASANGSDYSGFGVSGFIAKTSNGGNNWINDAFVSGVAFTSVCFINSQTGWCYGYTQSDVPPTRRFVYRTTNTGVNWTRVFKDSIMAFNPIPNKIHFPDTNIGFITFNNSLIKKTTDEGYSWNTFDSANTYGQSDIFFINKNTGWVCKNPIIRTDNGGLNWTNQEIPNSTQKLFFVNSNTGYAIGNSPRVILKTTTGGVNPPLDTVYTRYFPLNIGNVYVYNWVYSLGGGGIIKLKITKDTIINGRRYYNLSNKFPTFPGTNLVRIDSVNSNIYTYVGTGGCGYNPSEILVDSLKARINDTSHTCLSSPADLRRCTDTNTLNIFGYQTPTKRFIEVLILSPTSRRFGKNFGLNNASDGDPYPTNYSLNGCVINGVVYGDTTAPVTLYSVSGTVRYVDNNQPVTSGVVKAIKLNKNDASIIVYDTALIQSNGTYILNNVPQDSVYIGLYPNTGTTQDYVISYYPAVTDWHQATELYPTGNLTNIDLGAIRMIGTTAGNSVNGKVMRLTNSLTGNLKDAVLYAKNGNTFVRCGVSDVNGVYHLQSLPTGNLKIIVNRLGFSNDSTTVNVTPTSNLDSINFYVNINYVGIKQINNVVPSDFKLYQNYPNPFNPVTKIKFDVAPHSVGQTFLSVYDIVGREIQTLVNEKLNPGSYEVTFDGSNFATGVYFYQLRTGDFVSVKKMLMIK